MPPDTDKKIVDGEAEAIGLKSRFALKCCHNYLSRRECSILPVSHIFPVLFGHCSGIIQALFRDVHNCG